MSRVSVDPLDAIELAELAGFVDGWLDQCPDAAASYDRFVGTDGAVADLREALQRLAAALLVAPGSGSGR